MGLLLMRLRKELRSAAAAPEEAESTPPSGEEAHVVQVVDGLVDAVVASLEPPAPPKRPASGLFPVKDGLIDRSALPPPAGRDERPWDAESPPKRARAGPFEGRPGPLRPLNGRGRRAPAPRPQPFRRRRRTPPADQPALPPPPKVVPQEFLAPQEVRTPWVPGPVQAPRGGPRRGSRTFRRTRTPSHQRRAPSAPHSAAARRPPASAGYRSPPARFNRRRKVPLLNDQTAQPARPTSYYPAGSSFWVV